MKVKIKNLEAKEVGEIDLGSVAFGNDTDRSCDILRYVEVF